MNRLVRIVMLLTALTGVGTAWFWLVEGWTPLEAVYMTVITLSTVGYGETRPLTDTGRAFVVLFLVVGLGVFLYGTVQLGELIVRAELREWWRRRHMAEELRSIRDHFVVCGFGRMGRQLCDHFISQGIPFVAIDRDEHVLSECYENGWPALLADATDDRTLVDAGIDRARGLAAVLSSDADNLYVVLSARLYSNRLRIVSRAFDEKGVQKMEKAGADCVVSLYTSGAKRMAHLLTNPKLDDFFQFVTEGGVTLDLAEIRVADSSPFIGQMLSQTDLRRRGIVVVGIRRADGRVLLPPPEATIIEAGDDLFAIGNEPSINELMARP